MAKKKSFEISCSIADQNTFLHLPLAQKASKRHYTLNLIQFKEGGSVLFSERLIFGHFYFCLFVFFCFGLQLWCGPISEEEDL